MNDYELLGDLDEKQYYMKMTIKSLVSCELYRPDIQRLIDYERVATIINFQREYFEKYKTFLFVGEIVIVNFNDKFYVIDGLHRLEAIKTLVNLHPDYHVCVNLIECESKDEMIELFIMINQTQPVPEHVIRNASNIPKRILLEDFRARFRNAFKPYISTSSCPHRPNVNENNIMYYINKSDIDLTLASGDLIFKYMLYVNDKYLIKQDDVNSKKCLEKANKYKIKALYLSNDPDFSWLMNKKYVAEFLDQDSPQGGKLSFTNLTKGKLLFWKSNPEKRRKFDNVSNDNNTYEENDEFVPCILFEGQKAGYEYKQGDNGVGYYKINIPLSRSLSQSLSQSWSLPSNIGRKTIPKQLRGQVWRNYFDTIENSCLLCDNIISLDDFECGHVISVKNGGSNKASNLIPICGKCNKSMSSMNLDEYCDYCGITLRQ